MQIIENMPAADYHAIKALSSTGIKTLLSKSPAHFKWAQDNKTDDTATPAMIFGTAAHKAILEPDTFNDCYILCNLDMRTKAGKDFKEENKDKVILSEKDHAAIIGMRSELLKNNQMEKFLSGGVAELSFFWTDELGIECKARTDEIVTVVNNDLIILLDYKTTTDAHPKRFGEQFFRNDYDIQMAFYADALEKAFPHKKVMVVVVAQEKEPPYAFGMYSCMLPILNRARGQIQKAKEIYAACIKNDVWPSYSEKIQEIQIPQWIKDIEL